MYACVMLCVADQCFQCRNQNNAPSLVAPMNVLLHNLIKVKYQIIDNCYFTQNVINKSDWGLK